MAVTDDLTHVTCPDCQYQVWADWSQVVGQDHDTLNAWHRFLTEQVERHRREVHA